MELPKSYHQIKKIREFWTRSNSEQRDDMLKLFDETLRQIELEALLESEASTVDLDSDHMEYLRSIIK